MKIFFLTFLSTLLLCPTVSFSSTPVEKVTVFTYHSKQSENDHRFKYDSELLELALEKTKNKYGDYELKPLGFRANYKRILHIANSNSYPNLFFKHSVSNDSIKEFGVVPYPIDKGIVGYRVAFLSKENKNKLENIKSLDDLKDFSIVQGLGWIDVPILRHHGLNVTEATSYSGMFEMVALNRLDLLFRGVNEIYNEWQENIHLENLGIDESIMLYYPFPRFYHTNKDNKEAIKRVQEGLLIADKDGSLDALWMKHYGKSIKFINFDKRIIFKLDNPLISEIDPEYEKYFYSQEELIEMFQK